MVKNEPVDTKQEIKLKELEIKKVKIDAEVKKDLIETKAKVGDRSLEKFGKVAFYKFILPGGIIFLLAIWLWQAL